VLIKSYLLTYLLPLLAILGFGQFTHNVINPTFPNRLYIPYRLPFVEPKQTPVYGVPTHIQLSQLLSFQIQCSDAAYLLTYLLT